MRKTLLASALLAIALPLSVGGGCTGELLPNSNNLGSGGGADAGAGGGGGGSAGSAEGAAFYEANIAPLMNSLRPKGTCAGCHQGEVPANGPDFLGPTPADAYETIMGTPGLIGADLAQSRFYARGDHAGDAFCLAPGNPYAQCAVNERELISQWINIENGQ